MSIAGVPACIASHKSLRLKKVPNQVSQPNDKLDEEKQALSFFKQPGGRLSTAAQGSQ
jgi:hypothetical protein